MRKGGELDLVTTGGAEGKTGRYDWSGWMSPILYVCVDIPLDPRGAQGKGQAVRNNCAKSCRAGRLPFSVDSARWDRRDAHLVGTRVMWGQIGAHQRHGSRGWLRVSMSSLMLLCSQMARQGPRALAPACAWRRGNSRDEDEAGRRSEAPRVHGRCGVARADAAKGTLQRLPERGTRASRGGSTVSACWATMRCLSFEDGGQQRRLQYAEACHDGFSFAKMITEQCRPTSNGRTVQQCAEASMICACRWSRAAGMGEGERAELPNIAESG